MTTHKDDWKNFIDVNLIAEEVARIALDDHRLRSFIGHELDLSDEVLEFVLEKLEGKLNDSK